MPAAPKPTQLMKKFPPEQQGTQYRSVIFYTTLEQKIEAEKYFQDLEYSSPGGSPIVTEIEPLDNFYKAEDYHRDYFSKNPDKPYIRAFLILRERGFYFPTHKD